MVNGFYTCVERKMNNILYRGYDEDGLKVYSSYRFKPTLYVESKDKNAKWKSLQGVALEPIRFDSMSESREFIKSYEGVNTFKIFGNEKHIPAFIQSQFPGKIAFDRKLIDIAYIDIETAYGLIPGLTTTSFPEPAHAHHPILTIALKSSKHKSYIVWGQKHYDSKRSKNPIEYRQFDSETEMLSDFLDWWSDQTNTPDIISGWNTVGFDIPYLVNRLSRVLSSDDASRLSPWGKIEQRNVTIQGRDSLMFDIFGIQQLDYLELFKKFTLNTFGAQESYKLDDIAEVVLGENKLHFDSVDSTFKLLIDSSCVNVRGDAVYENLETFEKWCVNRDKIKAELRSRKAL